MMRTAGLLCTALLATSAMAEVSVRPKPFNVPAQDLGAALSRLSELSNDSILYDPALVAGLRGHAVRHSRNIDDALSQLLAGSDLAYRHTGAHAVVLIRNPIASPPGSAPASAPAVPDILVVGHNRLNIDIPRTEDDIQPYQVVSYDEIARSGDQTLNDFLKEQVSANSTSLSPSQAPFQYNAGTQSQIDLRGLGPDQTLVLVDGHRLPGYPAPTDFLQSNINGIPVSAIARIETLPSTAGGIYGPGATGGVVNIVLKHDSKTTGISLTRGVTGRGDSPSYRIDAHTGYETPDGRTKASLLYSHEDIAALTKGERSYGEEARATRFSNDPLEDPPPSTNINVRSVGSSNLILKPAYGGTNLGSSESNFALATLGTAQMISALILNSGHYDTSLSADGQGADQTLLTAMRNDSVDASIRHEFGPAIEAYVDFFGFRSVGTATGSRLQGSGGSIGYIAATDPANPFTTGILYSFPSSAVDAHYVNRTSTYRITEGLIIRLPFHWRADIDVSEGKTTENDDYPESNIYRSDPIQASGLFDNPATFGAALVANEAPNVHLRSSDSLIDANLKLAGPLFRLPGGTATMTLSGEVRSDHIPGTFYTLSGGVPITTTPPPTNSGSQRQSVQSLFDEVRFPLAPNSARLFLLRGLELQLAARMDHYKITAPSTIGLLDPAEFGVNLPTSVSATHVTGAFTAGAMTHPLSGLELRMSYATGYLPPTAGEISPLYSLTIVNDPIRHSYFPSFVVFNAGGSPALDPEKAQSLSAGIVAKPSFLPGLRLSVDYTWIKKSKEISTLYSDPQYIVTHESLFPQRVIRGPLTAQDAALGNTVGPILLVDASPMNIGHTHVQALDFDGSYSIGTRFGLFTISGHATWEPHFTTNAGPGSDTIETAGYFDGPLVWKGSGGIAWQKGGLSLGSSIQYYSSYKIALSGNSIDNAQRIEDQGATKVPRQIYANAFLSYHLRPEGHRPAIDYMLTVDNILNTSVPIVVPGADQTALSSDIFTTGYSYYGDPRGRRFQLTVSVAL